MKSKVLLSLALIQLVSTTAFGQDGTSGGDDGLDFRIRDARELAQEALNTVSADQLVGASSNIKGFYLDSRSALIEEVKNSKIQVRPQDEVVALVGGTKMRRKATTGFASGTDILISRELNQLTPVSELTAILLHEAGHHLGIVDENNEVDHTDELFLNQYALAVLKVASQNTLFRARLYGNKPIYQLTDPEQRRGFAFSNSKGIHDYLLVFNFKEERFYLVKSTINDWPRLSDLFGPKVMRPMTINPIILANGKLPPEVVAQFSENNPSSIVFNVDSWPGNKYERYQVTVNFKDHSMTTVTVVPFRKGLPRWSKAITLKNDYGQINFNPNK